MYRHYLGYDLAEIAAELEVPLGTVKSRLHYATHALRSAMDADRRAASLEAWVADYCRLTKDTPCTGIADRAVPMCLEHRDCHPAVLVPFQDHVQAYFVGGGEPLTVVSVWRPESDPSVAP